MQSLPYCLNNRCGKLFVHAALIFGKIFIDMTEEQKNKGQKQKEQKTPEEQQKKNNAASEHTNSGKKAKKSKQQRENEKEKEALKEKLAELNDKHLRLFSEFDNFRKRSLKEKIQLTETASEEVLVALLPVLDDFERAINSMDEANVEEKFKEGVMLIFNKFITVLNQRGLKPMKTIGEEFNTDYHEAVTEIPAPSGDMQGKVVDEIEKGYMLNGKVIRYAKVIVGKKS